MFNISFSPYIVCPDHCRFSSLLAHNNRNEHSFLPFLVLVSARWENFAPLWIPAQLRSEERERKKKKNLALRLSPVVVLIIIRGTGFVIILYVYHRPFLCPYQSWRGGMSNYECGREGFSFSAPFFFLRGKEGGGRHVSYYSGGGGESWNLGSCLSSLLLPTWIANDVQEASSLSSSSSSSSSCSTMRVAEWALDTGWHNFFKNTILKNLFCTFLKVQWIKVKVLWEVDFVSYPSCFRSVYAVRPNGWRRRVLEYLAYFTEEEAVVVVVHCCCSGCGNGTRFRKGQSSLVSLSC